ncbi:hypothetical protein BS47DRAFT_1373915 [Hydnum rufescens UP504]|uniref:Elongator complex protein 2 n=1 Tax=Hydnum rufescens UP504 TaxID=1448309 RepID=A0A9P6AK89_9AGAM|nr:hypothetical protein BS47DRAFT_1373915 [Hydnum rufescens UP504]
MRQETIYISAAANRHPHAASISSASSLVVFGTRNLLALWNIDDDRGIYQTLPGHSAEVTCVDWIEPDHSFASGDQSGSLRVWKKSHHWTHSTQIQAHSSGISALAAFENLIVTGSSDASLKVWFRSTEDEHLILLQSIDMKGRFPLDVKISRLPNSSSAFSACSCHFISSLSLEGHEDWVRSLSFSLLPSPLGDVPLLTLASGSQDGYIRLWVIAHSMASSTSFADDLGGDELIDSFEKKLGNLEDAEEGGKTISNRAHVFSVFDGKDKSVRQYTLTFDALLIGHEPASTDSSLILWSPTSLSTTSSGSFSSLWTNRQRFGDVGGVKAGGFAGGLWAGGGMQVLGWGWNGSWRRWGATSDAELEWIEMGAVGGHQGPVRGVTWDSTGRFLLSTSLDQTTRIHGPWKHNLPEASSTSSIETWHEIARPQIHGYDLISAAFIGSYRFISVADEKVARVFEAPKGFLNTLKGINAEDPTVDTASRASGASLPPLGLSNKASAGDESTSLHEVPTRPPLEPELASLTLWPEVEKIFDHGYELISVASSHSGSLVATACKSTTAEHAAVRLHETTTWRAVGPPLAGHSLTVTRIAFSHDDRYILTVSRDRSWRLFERQGMTVRFAPVAHDKSHARIIWDAAWTHEDHMFATAARDKTVKIWQKNGTTWSVIHAIKLKEGATAVDFLPADSHQRRRLAVGLENGEVIVYASALKTPNSWQTEVHLDSSVANVDQIHRLAWRPKNSAEGVYELAVCSEDRSLRIIRLSVL